MQHSRYVPEHRLHHTRSIDTVMAVHLRLRTHVLVLVSNCKMNHSACVPHFFGIGSQCKHVNLTLSDASLFLHVHVLFLLQAGIISSQGVSEALKQRPCI